MNGNHAVPRFAAFIEAEAQRTQPTFNEVIDENPGLRDQIGTEFFKKWVLRHEWGLK